MFKLIHVQVHVHVLAVYSKYVKSEKKNCMYQEVFCLVNRSVIKCLVILLQTSCLSDCKRKLSFVTLAKCGSSRMSENSTEDDSDWDKNNQPIVYRKMLKNP